MTDFSAGLDELLLVDSSRANIRSIKMFPHQSHQSEIMNESPKFSVNFSNLLIGVLREGIEMLNLIQSFPVDDVECKINDEGACHSLIDLKTFLTCKEVQGALNKQKLHYDCRDLVQLLSDVTDELRSIQTFTNLVDYVDGLSEELLKFHFILENYQEQKKAKRKMEGFLGNQKEHDQQKEAKVDNELFNQHILHYKDQLDNEIEKNYNETWVKAHVRQNEIELNIEEERINDQLLDIARKTYETDDVYFKTSKFYVETIKQFQEQAELISTEYDIQVERLETELQIASNDRRQMKVIMEAEYEAFEQREREMSKYLNEKQKKAEAKKLRELQEFKVLVIQAWWRGEMVRHHFGHFKLFKKRAREIKKEFQDIKAKRQSIKKKNKK